MPAHLNPWRPAISDHPLPRPVFPSRRQETCMRKLLTLWIVLVAIVGVHVV